MSPACHTACRSILWMLQRQKLLPVTCPPTHEWPVTPIAMADQPTADMSTQVLPVLSEMSEYWWYKVELTRHIITTKLCYCGISKPGSLEKNAWNALKTCAVLSETDKHESDNCCTLLYTSEMKWRWVLLKGWFSVFENNIPTTLNPIPYLNKSNHIYWSLWAILLCFAGFVP